MSIITHITMRMLLQRIDHQKRHGCGNGIIIVGYNIYGYTIFMAYTFW